jgi:hypothetical protein
MALIRSSSSSSSSSRNTIASTLAVLIGVSWRQPIRRSSLATRNPGGLVLIDGPPSSVRQIQRPSRQGINRALEWARAGQTPTPALRFA